MQSVQFSSGFFFNKKNKNEAIEAPQIPDKQSLPDSCSVGKGTRNTTESPGLAKPSPKSESGPLSALPPLMLNGDNFHFSSGVRLENEFIQILKKSPDPQEKAGMAEMLGRAHSINALPSLLHLLGDNEPVSVRTVAASAVSEIGAATHKNSYTATEIADTLIQAYKHRKAQMAQRLNKPTDAQPYEGRLKEQSCRKAHMEELKTLLASISRLNVAQSKRFLQDEYRQTLSVSLMDDEEAQAMIRAIRLAEETFHKALEKKYQRPAAEIIRDISRKELEAMKKKVLLQTPKGEAVNLLDASTQLAFLRKKQEQFGTELLIGLMDAMAIHEDKNTTASLKMALLNNNPEIKAKSLKLLCQRNSLNYNSDVYPHLYARDIRVRKAAFEALLHAQEPAARQKALELLKPRSYLDLMGELNGDALREYGKFLERIALNGDEYVDALANRALHSDYDRETRQVALLVLGMMTQKPITLAVSPQTRMQAMTTIKALALRPPARSPEDFEAISLTATQLWATQQDPQAIHAAIGMAASTKRSLTGLQQANLLGRVFSALQASQRPSEAERRSETLHQILDMMRAGQPPSLKEDEVNSLRQTLSPRRIQSWINLKENGNLLETEHKPASAGNKSLIEVLAPDKEKLRPLLTRLAESEKSANAQMLALRILGLLRDEESLNYLKERVHDPLKNRIDWNADVSYDGNPAAAAANIRLNALVALGDIGHSGALDTMTDALDDPLLKNFVSEPIGKVASHANEHAGESVLERTQTKLVRLMETPDTSRGMRAIRMQAANALYQFRGGVEAIRQFAHGTPDPNFKRHALSALLSNNHGLEPTHSDHGLVKPMTYPGLGVERLHEQGITGKGVQMAIVDGGYVDRNNTEGFQNRVKLPAMADEPEHVHPTMVMSTAAANGKLKGVAPEATVFSDQWPDFASADTMDVYKKIIEGKLRGENNVRVINNSWGFSSPNAILSKGVRKILQDYKNVVNLAEKAGIQMVFAAGNEGEKPGFPKIGTLSAFGLDIDKLTADEQKTVDYLLEKVIVVGALNTQGDDVNRANHRIAEFSSRGDGLNRKLTPTVVAPGADMMVYSWDPYKGNPKTLVNGTSFASPYVSGLLSLMLQKNPNLTPAEMRDILKKTAVRLPDVPVTEQGHGEVNPQAAVSLAGRYALFPLKRKADDGLAGASGSDVADLGSRLKRRKSLPFHSARKNGERYDASLGLASEGNSHLPSQVVDTFG